MPIGSLRLDSIVLCNTLLSLLCLNGKTAFTELQDSMLRAAIRHGRNNRECSRRVRWTLRKALLCYDHAGIDILFIADNSGLNFYSAHTRQEQQRNAARTSIQIFVRLVDPSRLFYPSELANIDVASHHRYSHIYLASTAHTSYVDIDYFVVVHAHDTEFMSTSCILVGF